MTIKCFMRMVLMTKWPNGADVVDDIPGGGGFTERHQGGQEGAE